MGRLVSSISCSGRSCHGDGRRPCYGDCSGSVGCGHGVRRHGSLVNRVTGHCGGVSVGDPGSWLLTGAAKTGEVVSFSYTYSNIKP